MAAHDSAQPIWVAEGAEKGAHIERLFAEIAPHYDRMNGLMSLSLDQRWRAAAVGMLRLSPGNVVLDLCCGTGSFLVPLRRSVGPEGTLIGIDFCLPMLERARQKDSQASLKLGDACRLPLKGGVFDAVTVGWGIRNVPSIDAAHEEIFRVLKPGGRFVSIDMAIPGNPAIRAASRLMSRTILPNLGRLFGSREAYTYLPESAERFLSREALVDSMIRAGFERVTFRNFMGGNICAHLGKKP
jgi:demethylmenaquinone methyltransferase/2-methoxy-6-polyprenyl-1,4-benzoquinol methylase